MRNVKDTARRSGNFARAAARPVSRDVPIIPEKALVWAFGTTFALMALWEVVTSWM